MNDIMRIDNESSHLKWSVAGRSPLELRPIKTSILRFIHCTAHKSHTHTWMGRIHTTTRPGTNCPFSHMSSHMSISPSALRGSRSLFLVRPNGNFHRHTHWRQFVNDCARSTHTRNIRAPCYFCCAREMCNGRDLGIERCG